MGYADEKKPVWLFFDKGSYIVMVFMMTLGITLRVFQLVPNWFIAFFYAGLGTALALAGVGFFIAAIQAWQIAHTDDGASTITDN